MSNSEKTTQKSTEQLLEELWVKYTILKQSNEALAEDYLALVRKLHDIESEVGRAFINYNSKNKETKVIFNYGD